MDKYLPNNYKLNLTNEIYTIERKIGNGATCAAYLAENNNQHYIIKEYCPSYIAFTRDDDGKLFFTDEKQRSKFEAGLNNFEESCNKQKELREIIELENSIPPVYGEPFSCNNTRYFIVVPFNGNTYGKIIDEKSITERIEICYAVAKLALKFHEAGYRMLDIKPENIFVWPDINDHINYIDYDSIRTKDELAFGNSLSYTKEWAAPEQLNPYSYDDISPKTDIYTLGELVYWSIFDKCHSDYTEHRRLSTFPFDDKSKSFYSDFENPEVRRLFTELFHMTIRSSVRNRANSMQEVIDKLTEIKKELEKENYVIPTRLNPNKIFVGREYELGQIKVKLNRDHILFLSGIGGIGKSELAKQFANKNDYTCCYITYEGTLVDSINKCVNIANFLRYGGEKEEDYCIRKLHKLKELVNEHYLILIDNMNIRLSDLTNEDYKAWNELSGCSCCILITTRCESNEYSDLVVTEIKDEENLIDIYNQYYKNSYNENETDYVKQIICQLQHHTLLIELIAKQSKEGAKTPREMYEILIERGIMNLGAGKITIKKDGLNKDSTVNEVLKAIYDTSGITEKQKLILAELSLMPLEGIEQALFCDFFKITDHNDIKYLRDNGWIKRNDYNISIHPAIAETIIDISNKDYSFIDKIGSFLIDNINIGNKVVKKIIVLYNSIAIKIIKYRINATMTIIKYLCLYAWLFQYNGLYRSKLQITDYVIDKLRGKKIETNLLNVVYDIKVGFILRYYGELHKDAIDICNERLNNDEVCNNKYWKTVWEFNRIFCFEKSENIDFNEYKKMMLYFVKSCLKLKRIFNNDFEDTFEREYLIFRINEVYEAIIEFDDIVYPSLAKKFLIQAIKRRTLISQDLYFPLNEIILGIDNAIKLDMDNNNEEAIEEINRILEKYSNYDSLYGTLFLKCHVLLCKLYFKTGRVQESIEEYNRCLKLGDHSDILYYKLYLKLIRSFYDNDNELDFLLNNNNMLGRTLMNPNSKGKGYFWVCLYFDLGYIYQIKGDYDDAIECYENALKFYGLDSKARGYKYQESLIRIKTNMAEIECLEGNNKDAIKLMKKVVSIATRIYGKNHDLTSKYKAKLDELKNKR